MKTIIVNSKGNVKGLSEFIETLESFAERNVSKDIVICERFMDETNYNTICGELKDAVNIDDYDVFVIGVRSEHMSGFDTLQSLNRSHTFICEVNDNELESAKNFLLMD